MTTGAKHEDYWQKRFEDLEKARYNKSSKYGKEKLAELFRQSESELTKEIESLYARYASLEGNISRAELEKRLSTREREELKWTLEEYKAKCEEYARKYGLGEIDQELLEKLQRVSTARRISKLDFLRLQLRIGLEKLYANTTDSLGKELLGTYKNSYYHTGYEIQQGTGEYSNFDRVDTERAKTLLNTPWVKDGKTFSDRLWRDKEKLIKTLESELPKAFTRGASLPDIARLIAKKMNAGYFSAYRLIMTESAFFASIAQKDAYDFLEVKKYKFLATLDLRTSETCQSMDGKIYALTDMKPGKNAPPMHCHCRSTTVPYIEGYESTTRAARDPITGKSVSVEGGLNYEDWRKIYVDKTMTLDEWRGVKGGKHYHICDATASYKASARQNTGSIKFDEGYRISKHKNEVQTAEWLLANFGGDVVLLDEPHRQDTKSPDYLWNGKHWDLKTVSTEKAADSALRYGIKQITGNAGGVILRCASDNIDKSSLIQIVTSRLKRSAKESIDVVLIVEDELLKVIRYINNKER